MSATETETVGLNLDGDFAAQAERDAAAADKLAKSLEKMDKLRAASKKAGGLGGFDKGLGDGTPAALKAGASNVIGAFPKIVGAIGKLFGDNAAAGLMKGAGKIADVAEKIEPYAPLIKAGAGALAGAGATVAAGAAAVTAAAVALAAAGAAVLYAGIKFGIERSDAAQTQKEVFSKIGKGDGYKVAIKVAADLGLDEGAAQTKVKALLNAKFKSSQVEGIIKIGLGLDEVQGGGAGDKFVKTLEQIKNAGKFDAKSVKQFAKEGISAKEIYAKLAKSLGISVDAAKAKVKAGTLDIDQGIKGVLDVADKKFGSIGDKLGNSIPGLINRIKVRFGELFTGLNIGPVKGFLKNIASVLDSGDGKAFGKAFGKLGSTVIELLFGPMSGSAGKDKMGSILRTITKGVDGLTAKLKESAPTIKAAAAAILDILSPKKGSDGPGAKVREMAADFLKLYTSVKPIVGVMLSYVKVPLGAALTVFTVATKILSSAFSAMVAPITGGINAIKRLVDMIFGSAPKAAKGGKTIGKAVPDGILQGILGGSGAALAAAGNLAAGLLARVKSVLGVASPSKAFAFVGAMNAQGMAKGMNDNAQAPANAAAKMASGAAAAAGGAGGKVKGAGADGGGGSPVFNISIVAAPGMTEGAARALGAAAGDGAYEAWKKNQRTYQREKQEGKAA